jgi:organic radical activating enzyme
MKCDHCCYSCSNRGKHGEYNTIVDAVAFIREYSDETISIGGGEPTLHPRFFDILKMCLEDFTYVWMATNGSQTETMYRLAEIIDGNDLYHQLDQMGCECDPDDLEDGYECDCHDYFEDYIYQEDKLSVALSLDPWHDPIDERIVDLWTRRANQHRHSHFEIRDVSKSMNGAIAEGRGKRTGAAWAEGCVCPDFIIRIDGSIKLCGCSGSPVIGDVWRGIDDKWQEVTQSDKFNDTRCYKSAKIMIRRVKKQ